MKKLAVLLFLVSFLLIPLVEKNPAHALIGCFFNTISTTPGTSIGIVTNSEASDPANIKVRVVSVAFGNATELGTIPKTGGAINAPNIVGVYKINMGEIGSDRECVGTLTINAPGSGSGSTALGTITPPAGIPNPPDANIYVADVIRNGIRILLVVAFLAMFLWTIFAGFRFVTSGGDEKTISQAWSSIYYGIIGMIVVMSSFALVRLVEIFFNVNIVSGGLQLPGP